MILDQSLSDSEPFGRDRLVRAMRRAAPRVLIATLVAGGAAFALSLVLPPTYRATAQLFVAPTARPTVALQEVVLGPTLARSYVQLAAAEVVLRPAMQKVGATDLEEFRKHTTVTQVRDTFVINISFDHDDRGRAAAAANAIAESFVTQSGSLQAALQGTVSIWQPATPPSDPESPKVALNIALGALMGALATLLVIGAMTYFDDRLTDFDEIRTRLGIAPLDEIRSAKADASTGKLFVRDAPRSPEAEAFRSLRTSISLASVDKRPRTILVTSALPSEGKSVVSANLALAYAQEGTPTILIDADLRRPSQHTLFALDPRHGLTNIVTADTLSADDVRRFRVSEHLLVIPTGPLPPNPAEFLSSAKMSSVLEQLVGVAANCTVIIDSSPVLGIADSVALSTKVDGCVMVVDTTRTHARAVRRAIERLKNVNATVLGAVLNKVSTARGYYGYKDAASDIAGGADGPASDRKQGVASP